jgi:hypothetical protein
MDPSQKNKQGNKAFMLILQLISHTVKVKPIAFRTLRKHFSMDKWFFRVRGILSVNMSYPTKLLAMKDV